MEKICDNKYPLVRQEGNEKKIILPGYPTYPASDDIYVQGKEEKEIDPEEILENKKSTDENLGDDQFGNDLDVPGSELDDNEEEIGSEDEENNYYSLGGDDHDN